MKKIQTSLSTKLKNAKGFTLVEMVVVIAIIAILVALIAPNVAALIRDASDVKEQARAKTVMSTMQAWNTKHIKDDYTFTPGSTASVHVSDVATAAKLYVYTLTGGTANATAMSMWSKGTVAPTPTTAINLIGDGDTYLPANTLGSNLNAYVYITAKGAIMGVVVTDSNNLVIGVAGSVALGANCLIVPTTGPAVTTFDNGSFVGLSTTNGITFTRPA